jgi:hypothetical protein
MKVIVWYFVNDDTRDVMTNADSHRFHFQLKIVRYEFRFDNLVLHLEMHEKLKIVEAEWELNMYFTWLTQHY